VAAGALALILLVALPIVAAPGWFRGMDEKRRGQATASVTSTVYGVSITYPGDWTLLQLNAQLEMGGTETSSMFQLSNFDPLDNNDWLCPLPSGTIPAGGVVLFLQEIVSEHSAPAWPVDLGSGAATFDTCGRRMARWQVGGRTFEAGVVGDLDGGAYRQLVTTFRSMAFEPPDDDSPLGTEATTVDNAYVVASGREDGEPWNLLAFEHDVDADREVCIGLDPIGAPEYRCWINPIDNDWMNFELDVAMVGGTPFAFGWAPAETRRLETLDGRPLGLATLPDGLRVGARAFVGPADEEVADGVPLVEVHIVDDEGVVVDRQQWIDQPGLEPSGGPELLGFDHAFGELWWFWYDGDRVFLKTRGGVIRSIAETLLPGAEHLRVFTHTFTEQRATGTRYETIVFGVSSGEASQVTLLLETGAVQHARQATLEYEIDGPDLIELGHLFWASVPGAVRGEVVAMDTGCRVLARVALHPETPAPSGSSPPPEPELPCIGP
jgi:hypothetical protein